MALVDWCLALVGGRGTLVGVFLDVDFSDLDTSSSSSSDESDDELWKLKMSQSRVFKSHFLRFLFQEIDKKKSVAIPGVLLTLLCLVGVFLGELEMFLSSLTFLGEVPLLFQCGSSSSSSVDDDFARFLFLFNSCNFLPNFYAKIKYFWFSLEKYLNFWNTKSLEMLQKIFKEKKVKFYIELLRIEHFEYGSLVSN